MKPDWVPSFTVLDANQEPTEIWINDTKHYDDFEPCRIICQGCKREIPAMRGEMVVVCGCGAVNRGYGTTEPGSPIVGGDDA